MDQPIITGSVYNRDNVPPWIGASDNSATASQKATQSGIKTRSTPNGGPENYNELRFEDKKGHEAIHLHAERNLNTSAESCESHTVGVDQTIQVGEDRKITVGRHEFKKVDGVQNLHVVGPSVTTCDLGRILEVTGMDYASVDSKWTRVEDSFRLDAGDITLQANTSIKLVVGENSITIDKRGVTVIGLPLIALNPVPTVTQMISAAAAQATGEGITAGMSNPPLSPPNPSQTVAQAASAAAAQGISAGISGPTVTQLMAELAASPPNPSQTVAQAASAAAAQATSAGISGPTVTQLMADLAASPPNPSQTVAQAASAAAAQGTSAGISGQTVSQLMADLNASPPNPSQTVAQAASDPPEMDSAQTLAQMMSAPPEVASR
jgi:hypothetical protein